MGKIQRALEIIFNDRKELGKVTQAGLARITGYSRAYVHNLLCGSKRLNEDSIIKICEALEISLSDVDQVILHGKFGVSSKAAEHQQQSPQNAKPEYSAYHDLLNTILYNAKENGEDFRQGIKMTLISYATAIIAKEDARNPDHELLKNALKAIETKES